MKNGVKHNGRVALLLAGITAVAVVVTAFTATVGVPRAKKTVLTTTPPLYAAVKQILGDTDDVTVENLTGSATGCLHDYQLSPANRIALQHADLVVLNGKGAEEFLTDTLAGLPASATVDTSAKVASLHGGHEHDGHTHEGNEHVWTSPSRYVMQVKAVQEALCALDPSNAATYAKNSAAYCAKIEALGERLRTAAARLPSKHCVIFHDSLAYFADELGLTVEACLHVGEEGGVSPADLATAQQAATTDSQLLVLYDNQYTVRYASVDSLVADGQVMAVDTAMRGDITADSWLTAMEYNATVLEGLL